MLVDTLTGLISLPGDVLKRAVETALGSIGQDNVLDIAQNAFRKATQTAILRFVGIITRTILSAMLGYLGPIETIWKALLQNPANTELFNWLQSNWDEIGSFMVDLLEPMKRFVMAESPDGTPMPGAEMWNNYNELDLSQPMNRHAVLGQVQRSLKSLVEIFRQRDVKDDEFAMDTKLETDGDETAMTMTVLKRRDDIVQKPETWLFVNGIAGEFYWNRLAVHKIRDFFFDPDHVGDNSEETVARRTEIRGVFNRSDGIIWDLIECGGERRPETAHGKTSITSRTPSSLKAQKQLSQELRNALIDSQTSKKDIIMIAHSQGCLLLRLALVDIYLDRTAALQSTMAEHLHVFTFGNPAYDWDVHAYAAHTEHFANELDFVAKLGVLRPSGDGILDAQEAKSGDNSFYCSRCRAGDRNHKRLPKQRVFVNNKNQKGHLFGSQYSLQKVDYDCVNDPGKTSELLERADRRNVGPRL